MNLQKNFAFANPVSIFLHGSLQILSSMILIALCLKPLSKAWLTDEAAGEGNNLDIKPCSLLLPVFSVLPGLFSHLLCSRLYLPVLSAFMHCPPSVLPSFLSYLFILLFSCPLCSSCFFFCFFFLLFSSPVSLLQCSLLGSLHFCSFYFQ